jgi:hypothetical protein
MDPIITGISEKEIKGLHEPLNTIWEQGIGIPIFTGKVKKGHKNQIKGWKNCLKTENLLELKQRISQIENKKVIFENEKSTIKQKLYEVNTILSSLRAIKDSDPSQPILLSRPEIISQKNQIEKELHRVKTKIQRLEISYDETKNLEIKTEEEEKQKKIIEQKKKEAIETTERRKEIIEAMKPERKELQLLFQSASVFDNLSKRGIGFDIAEKKIIKNLKDYLLTQ